MRKRIEIAILAVTFVLLLGFGAQNVSAAGTSRPDVVISQVQVRDATSSYNEIVEIYNNSVAAVDITNWCMFYASKDYLVTGSDWRKLACYAPTVTGSEISLGGQSYGRIISSAFEPLFTGSYLSSFTAALGNDAGHVRLVDQLGVEIDRVGWGSLAGNPEDTPATIGPSGTIERKFDIDRGVLVDTDNNAADFFDISLDLCRNMMGLQDMVPLGYLSDADRNCNLAPDLCDNLDGLQFVVPDGYVTDGLGGCISLDVCVNLDGIQLVVPRNYILEDDGRCINDLLPLKITELLPNPIGNDVGSEFIEIFNPNNRLVDLTDYKLGIGLKNEKVLTFPSGSTIGSQAFEAFSNADLAFTLVNSSSQVKLLLSDDTVIDATDIYEDPLPGMSWALINATWQYTDQITPGASNLEKTIETVDMTQTSDNEITSAVILKPCAPNQYRSPETNRCRLIVSEPNSVLVPCKDGQYRSEETNRCRSIASDIAVIVPCSAGEERNPETNRCRSVLGASTELAPCAAGEERNPETNRCRKVVSTIPTAGFAVEPIADTASGVAGWWAFGGVGSLALGYAGWEWRSEILGLLRKIGSFWHSSK